MLDALTREDLDELDEEIASVQARLEQLRHVRKIAGVRFGEPLTRPGPSARKKAAAANGTANGSNGHTAIDPDKLDDLRRRVARHLIAMDRVINRKEIITACRIAPVQLAAVLDHEWFSQSDQGVHLTPVGRRDLC